MLVCAIFSQPYWTVRADMIESMSVFVTIVETK